MTESDMTQYWTAQRRGKQERQRQNLASANPSGWQKHTPYHWYRHIEGEKLEYWPSTKKFAWKGQIMTGDVEAFINDLLNEGK